jgi:hypothetical protein
MLGPDRHVGLVCVSCLAAAQVLHFGEDTKPDTGAVGTGIKVSIAGEDRSLSLPEHVWARR